MMKQRFAIRLGMFLLLALLVGFAVGIGSEIGIWDSVLISGWILCLIYSGRLLWPCLVRVLSTLMKAGFVAVLFGSLPGVLIVLAAVFFLSGVLIASCVIVGCIQILRELVESIRSDAMV